MKKWLPLFLTGVMAAWFLSTLRPPQDQDFAWSQFGRLPILYKGRVKPIDSLARNSLLQIREKQEANLEPWKAHTAHPKIISATEWLGTLVMDPAKADEWPVFRIDNPDVIALLRLPEKDAANHLDGKHYSWNQIEPSLSKLEGESQRIQGVEASHRTAYERAVMKTRERLWIYVGLKETLQPPDAENWESEVNEFEKAIPAGVAAVQAQQAGLAKNDASTNDASLTRFAAMVQRFDSMSRFDPPLLIPPVHDGAVHHDWMRTGEALLEGMRSGKVDAAVHSYAAMATAFKTGNVQKFNQEVSAYRASLLPNLSRALQKSRYEAFFNQMEPFYAAMVIYVLAGILGLFFWFNLSETLRRSAVWLVVLALVIHTTGLIFRMALEGRPPVTNLYSSAIFIGWGACVLGLVLERIHRNGIGVVVSSGIGFITLIIAHHLSLEGDTMEMMRAVLDTNFWLATHVVVVTLGYASTFVAGFLGLIYVILGLFTTRLSTSLSPQRASIAGATAGYAAGGVVGAGYRGGG